MSYKFKTLWFLFALAIVLVITTANENGPLAFNTLLYVTGAPGDQGTCANCHTSVPNNQQSAVTITFNGGNLAYQPGQTYNVSVTVTGSTINKYGFQMTSLENAADTKAGKFIGSLTTDTFYVQLAGSPGVYRRYIEQNTPGTGTWNLQWVAPPSNVGPITFYAAGNAAQFPTGATGDKPCTTSLVINEAMPPVAGMMASDTVICAGDTVSFTNLSTLHDNTNWRFSGGSPSQTNDENPKVVYNNAGLFDVKLIVTNSFGTDSIFKSQWIRVNPIPVLATSVTHISCNGTNDGQIRLAVTGGTPPFSFAWSNGESLQNIDMLSPGPYCVWVFDQNGCSAMICDTIFEPNTILVQATQKDVSCYGAMDGWIHLGITGGIRPYGIHWSDNIGDTLKPNLSGGTYQVTVTDGNGCTSTSSYSISEPDSFTVTTIVTPETTAGNDGNILLNVSGATPPYTYKWSNNVTSRDNTNIPGGQYSVTITDDSSCTKVVTDFVPFPVGLNDIPNPGLVKIFPNPVYYGFHMVFENPLEEAVNYFIYDPTGKLIKTGKTMETDNFFEIGDWPGGYYIIKIRIGKKYFSQTLNIISKG